MFIGHFAVALGAKKVAPELNLGILFIACQLLDLIWPVLVLVGLERVSVDHMATVVTPLNFEHYPYSHSLLTAVVYSLGLGGLTAFVLKSRRSGILFGSVVFSHWVLDFVTHRPDLPIWFAGPKVGLGLWNSTTLAVAVELSIFALSVWLYLQATPASNRKQKRWFWGLIAFFLVAYAGSVFGPKPPVDTPAAMIAGPALAMWIFVLWGYLVDRKIEKA